MVQELETVKINKSVKSALDSQKMIEVLFKRKEKPTNAQNG